MTRFDVPRRVAALLVVAALGLTTVAGCTGAPGSASSTPSATPATTATGSSTATPSPGTVADLRVETFAVPAGSRPHDVAPAADGGVWFTAQGAGYLGHLDPISGRVIRVPLGPGAAPHGVIVATDGAAWVTDGGLNAIVRVDARTRAIRRFPLPANRPGANLNTAAFDDSGLLWFTGQNGVYGRLDPVSGGMTVYDAPGGRGPYGITVTPSGQVYYASLAGSHVARVDTRTGAATVLRPPTADQGARRVWSDSTGKVWVSEWNAGRLAVLDPTADQWREWPLPGQAPRAYAVYVDDRDHVWLSDFGSNTLVRFEPQTQRFTSVPLPGERAEVRQIHGRPGEVWGAASSQDRLVLVRTTPS
jgi:virginiamycin B lyase